MNTTPKTETIIESLRILAQDIQSNDGVANACIIEAADRLEELHLKCRWIPVEERLPSPDIEVAALCSGRVLPEIFWLSAGGEWLSWGRSGSVTHWMPIPEVPNE